MKSESPGQHLVVMKGFPATGKSLLAQAICRSMGWPLVDKDDVKDYTLHFENGNSIAYEIMWAVTRRQLAIGLSVVVDSPLTYPVAFTTATELASTYRADLLVVETQLDEAIWRERLAARDPGESAHKIASWEAMQTVLEQYEGCWQFPIPARQHLSVDASLSLELLVQQVLDRLNVSPARTAPNSATSNVTTSITR